MSQPSNSQFVLSCMFLIFTIYAFTHLELVASDIPLIKQVCEKTAFKTHCLGILLSNPNTNNAPRLNDLGVATVDLALSSTLKASNKAYSLIAPTMDDHDVELLKKCLSEYDKIQEYMRQARPLMQSLYSDHFDEVAKAGVFSFDSLAFCKRALVNVGSEIKNELSGMNQDIHYWLDIIMVIANFYVSQVQN